MAVLSVLTDGKQVSVINASAESSWMKMLRALIEDPQHLDLLHSVRGGCLRLLVTRYYGTALVVHFASRFDQIHFKLFAMVDQGGGRHETDLRALNPTQSELIAAARWSITHDPSPGYRSVLADALRALGIDDADLGD